MVDIKAFESLMDFVHERMQTTRCSDTYDALFNVRLRLTDILAEHYVAERKASAGN